VGDRLVLSLIDSYLKAGILNWREGAISNKPNRQLDLSRQKPAAQAREPTARRALWEALGPRQALCLWTARMKELVSFSDSRTKSYTEQMLISITDLQKFTFCCRNAFK
ncbi:MAG: hypothetical protein PHD01_13500, partial [Geobacteraceae bacterium]|nr:hypothetical protein [Geobacteraceae bacterium]